MSQTRILARSDHTVSRKDIDPDALKVLYRLKNHDYIAYLVGGGVRDLLLARKPKDFDIGTSAHPQQVKRLFRNCFIVGRRFRLCHVRFGNKVVEVSTFRRQAEAEEGETVIRRDNTFGTPEEDAFRRDFTVNALFYDIATFSVIDYVGGLEDLDARVIRTIGDPAVRLREDPVRMLRAVALAARLGFTIDRGTSEAIRVLRGEIVKSSTPRMLEEIYKVLRQGASRRTFEMLHETGLLTYLMPAAERAIAEGGSRLLGSLERLDEYRNASSAQAEALTNPILLGTLLAPLGLPLPSPRAAAARGQRAHDGGRQAPRDATIDVSAELAALDESEDEGDDASAGAEIPVALPFARRDLDRLRVILAAQRRLREVHKTPAVKHVLAGRGYFEEALRWLEIHGGVEGRELAAHWRSLDLTDVAPAPAHPHAPVQEHEHEQAAAAAAPATQARARRRRRRRPRRSGPRDGPASPQDPDRQP